jgi:DNA-binding MarR family transcriptional regulator
MARATDTTQGTTSAVEVTAVADGLRPALLRLGRELRREGRIAGLSPAQVAILVSIKYAPGICAADLATGERVSAAAMSKLVSRLERDGLVTRTQSASDRRRVGLTLTEEGRRVLRRIRSRRTAWLATRLRALEPEQLDAVAAAVEPLSQLLREEEGR